MKACKLLLIILINICLINNSYAANKTTVNRSTCKTITGTKQTFILIVEKDADIIDSIIECIETANITAATLNGIGALKDPVLSYYNIQSKEYENKQFTGIYELLSLNGNIAVADNKLFPHIHATLGDDKFNVLGGHLTKAHVGATAEIAITPMIGKITRNYNKETGLKLITTK